MKKNKDEIPEGLRKLVNLTLISKFQEAEVGLRAEAERKHAENAEKIEGLLARLAPIHRDLLDKLAVKARLEGEYFAIEGELEPLREKVQKAEEQSLADVKTGKLTYAEHQKAQAERKAGLESKERAIQARLEPALGVLRDLDREIKKLQFLWTELEFAIKEAASKATVEFVRKLEDKVKDFRIFAGSISTYGLTLHLQELRRHQGDAEKAVLFPFTVVADGDKVGRLLFDSRFPSRHLPEIREIIWETRLKGAKKVEVICTSDLTGTGERGHLKWRFL